MALRRGVVDRQILDLDVGVVGQVKRRAQRYECRKDRRHSRDTKNTSLQSAAQATFDAWHRRAGVLRSRTMHALPRHEQADFDEGVSVDGKALLVRRNRRFPGSAMVPSQ